VGFPEVRCLTFSSFAALLARLSHLKLINDVCTLLCVLLGTNHVLAVVCLLPFCISVALLATRGFDLSGLGTNSSGSFCLDSTFYNQCLNVANLPGPGSWSTHRLRLLCFPVALESGKQESTSPTCSRMSTRLVRWPLRLPTSLAV